MFDPVDEVVRDYAQGKFAIVLDDEDRENEGDLLIAASTVTTEQMAFLIKHSSGFVCISLTPERLDELRLPMMVPRNEEKHKTAYTITCDYRHDTTTGISAHDRALTSRMLADPALGAGADDFSRPGHMNPLRYTSGGVQQRRGHTEAAVDLAKAAGLPPAGLLCELVDPDDELGGIAARDACVRFARAHGIKITTIAALQEWQRAQSTI